MFLDSLTMLVRGFKSCLDWFGSIILNTGGNGRPFIIVFLGVFISYTFVRLFLVNFIGSVGSDAAENVKETIYRDASKIK